MSRRGGERPRGETKWHLRVTIWGATNVSRYFPEIRVRFGAVLWGGGRFLLCAVALLLAAPDIAHTCCGRPPMEGTGGMARPNIVPPIRPVNPTDLIVVDPSRAFPDSGVPETPEMAPPVVIDPEFLDIGLTDDLRPHRYPPRVIGRTRRGSVLVEYYDRDGNVIGTAHIFPNPDVFANDPFFSEARVHLRIARARQTGETMARTTVILSDAGLTLLGLGPVPTVIYAGGRAAAQSGTEAYVEDMSPEEAARHVAARTAEEAAFAAAFEGMFLRSGAQAAEGVAQAEIAAARAEARAALAADTQRRAGNLLRRAGQRGATRAEMAAVRQEAAAAFSLPNQALRRSKRGAHRLRGKLREIQQGAATVAEAAMSGPVRQTREALSAARNAEGLQRTVKATAGVSYSQRP